VDHPLLRPNEVIVKPRKTDWNTANATVGVQESSESSSDEEVTGGRYPLQGLRRATRPPQQPERQMVEIACEDLDRLIHAVKPKKQKKKGDKRNTKRGNGSKGKK
jgi:hypothetical protein